MKKRILIIASVVVVVIVCLWAAIGVYRRMEAFLDPQGAALNYMEKKYGEEFTMVFYGDDLMGSPTTNMYVSPVARPEWQAYIRQDKKTGKYSDNYVAFLFKPEVESWYQKLAEPIYGSCKVFCSISTDSWPDNILPDSPVEDAISADKMMFTILTDATPKERDEALNQLRNVISSYNIKPTYTICYLSTNMLDRMNANNINKFLCSPAADYYYTANIYGFEDYKGGTYPWEEGSLRD